MKLRVAVAGARYACLTRMLEPRPSRVRADSEPCPSRFRAASEPCPSRVRAASEPIPSRDRKGAVRLTIAAQYAAPYRMPTIKPPEESAS